MITFCRKWVNNSKSSGKGKVSYFIKIANDRSILRSDQTFLHVLFKELSIILQKKNYEHSVTVVE